ncbi:MAG: hypothetical protein QOF87_1631, partial [Pseudonocardiales bacterium]|nr:hypothetical protein [Pseudonocardiales bacterium]
RAVKRGQLRCRNPHRPGHKIITHDQPAEIRLLKPTG